MTFQQQDLLLKETVEFKFPYDNDDDSVDEVVYIRNVVIATP